MFQSRGPLLPASLAGIPARTRLAIKTRFQQLLSRVDPGQRDELLYAQHKTTVSRRLATAFAAHQVITIGSYTRGSAIASYSDLDLLLVLKTQEAKWGDGWKLSTTVLDGVRNQLQERYHRTEVGRDGQAVVVEFGDGEHPVDVVPGLFAGMEHKRPAYWIADGSGGWMKTSPAAHNGYILSADKLSAGKLKNAARLVKFWRVCRAPEIPLNSFHMELLLAQKAICAGVKTYGQCLFELFGALVQRNCAALQDPLGISGWVKAANSEAKRATVQSAVEFARDHAGRALLAEQSGDTQESIRQWNLVFNNSFPR
jgi:predicted nucleotidyltransferase